MKIWFLVLLCNCVQPYQPLFVSLAACDAQAKKAFFDYGAEKPEYRCVQVPR